MSPNNSLIKQLTDLGAHITDAVTAPYNQALNEYNDAVNVLRTELERKLPETPERLTRITELQQQVKAKAENFMLKERGLIDQFFKDQNVTPDPCARSL